MWSVWPELVASGTTPLRATAIVLSGGTAPARGFLASVDDDILRIRSTDDL